MKKIVYKNNKIEVKMILIILSFILLSILSNVILLHMHVLFSGYGNVQFHAKRIMELRYDYLNKVLNSPFSFNYFHGSAVMGLYPYLSLLPWAILSFFLKSYVNIYIYSFILITFVSLLVSYFSSLKYSNSKIISYIFSILYNISPVFYINAFDNGDLGITTSLVFLPLAIFGFIDIMNGSKNISKLVFGIFFMSLCQLPTTIITSLFLIFWAIINVTKLSKIILDKFIEAIFIIFLLSSIVWIPFLKVILFNSIITPGSPSIQSTDLIYIIQNIGFLPCFISLFIICFFTKFNKFEKQAYWLSLFIIIISSKLFPINFFTKFSVLKIISKFQFTSRFLIIPQILLCYLSAKLIYKLINNDKLYIYLILLISLSSVSLLFVMQASVINKNYLQSSNQYMKTFYSIPINKDYIICDNSNKYLYNGNMENDDYYPKSSLSRVNYINDNKGIYNRNNALNIYHKKYNTFDFYNKRHINKLTLPLLKYKKENISIKLDHHCIPYSVSKDNMITIKDLNPGRHILNVSYKPSELLIIIKDVLFLFGIIYLLITNFGE